MDFKFLDGKTNEEIKKYIDNSYNIDKIAFYLAKKGNLELIKYLLKDKNLNVNIYEEGETILFNACRSENIELVKYLVENGADTNAKSNKGRTILFPVCFRGNLELVKYLVEEKEINVNDKDEDNYTVLFAACKNGALELVKYLVEHGADINAKRMMYTYNYYDFEIPRKLIECESNNKWACKRNCNLDRWEENGECMGYYYDDDINNDDDDTDNDDENNERKEIGCHVSIIYQSILTYACKLEKIEIIKYLLRQNVTIEESVIEYIFQQNKFEIIEDIKNINIMFGDTNRTLLMFAILKNKPIEVVKLLICKGIDVNAKNRFGKTALWIAKKNGNTEIIDYLISVGAKE